MDGCHPSVSSHAMTKQRHKNNIAMHGFIIGTKNSSVRIPQCALWELYSCSVPLGHCTAPDGNVQRDSKEFHLRFVLTTKQRNLVGCNKSIQD
jgi:hypothetical protein